MPTIHQRRVRTFMQKAGQDTPEAPVVPDADTRILRAKLILEEAFETAEALGLRISLAPDADPADVAARDLAFHAERVVDVEGVADGCADISVVTVGTLIAFGMDDEPLLEEVDAANLRKFGPGGYRREDGKWMKPPDWTAPDIAAAIARGRIERQVA
jgi:predicted HAD superfamily Cof-like phosphohydrolase